MKKKKVILIGIDALILPLAKKLIGEGAMPNLAKMIKEGASSEAMPCLPPWTPTNWAVISTGSQTGTNDCYLWSNHKPDEPPDALNLFTFDSRAVNAETIWEAAEKAGLKSMVASYPGGWPPRIKNGYVVNPLDRGVTSHWLAGGMEYRNFSGKGVTEIKLNEVNNWKGAPPGAMEAELSVGDGFTAAPNGNVKTVNGRAQTGLTHGAVTPGAFELEAATPITMYLLLIKENGACKSVSIYSDKDAARPLAVVELGKWSSWGFIKMKCGKETREGAVRFKLLSLDPDGGNLRLLRSEVYNISTWTYPESLKAELLKELGSTFEWPVALNRRALGDVSPETGEPKFDPLLKETAWEELRYQAMWLPKAASYVQKKHGWDLYYQHWHLPDMLAHWYLSKVDPVSPFYDKTGYYWDIFREGYRIADEMIGEFLKLADNNTYVIVVSDHGSTPDYAGVADLMGFFIKKGYLAFKDNQIDWSKTRAFPHGLLQVEINLKGRNPYGCVDPADYENLQEEIIDAFYSWKDSETGKRPIAFALKKIDAQIVGYWGPTCADVVTCYNAGFAIGAPSGKSVGPARDYSEHWCKMPTDYTGLSSNLVAFIMVGPGIKKGYQRDPERLGFMKLTDVVPTISQLLGFRPPAQSSGAVLWDMIE